MKAPELINELVKADPTKEISVFVSYPGSEYRVLEIGTLRYMDTEDGPRLILYPIRESDD